MQDSRGQHEPENEIGPKVDRHLEGGAMRISTTGCLLALATLSSTPILAQDYPSRPIRIVVPTAPAGSPDVLARLLAERLRDRWGQPVVIENRAGAGQMIGAELVAKAPADG
jgi:tripartite-type tricarboxylate transporter receptor subunit TctC